jgi:hypothetical protein
VEVLSVDWRIPKLVVLVHESLADGFGKVIWRESCPDQDVGIE